MVAALDPEAPNVDVPAAASKASGATRSPNPGALLVGWAGISWAMAHVNGYYAGVSITLLLAGCAAVAFGMLSPRWLPRRLLPVSLGIVAAVEIATPFAHWQSHHPAAVGAWWLTATLLAGVATIAAGVALALRGLGRGPGWLGAALPVVLCVAVFADLAIILAAPDPGIDVFLILTDSSRGLLHGQDLYRQSWPHSTGLTDIYPYLPATTLLSLPGYLLGDARLVDVAALGVAAVLLHRLAARRATIPLLALLVIAYPRATLTVQNAWTEPLLLALLVGLVLAVETGHTRTAVGCFAVALASKQHIALLVPVAAWWPAFGLRRTLASVGLAVVIVAPWLIAGPRDLWHDAVTSTLAFPVLPTALDVPALLAHHGYVAGFWLALLGLIGAYAVCWRRLPRTAEGFAGGCALVLLALDLFNKQTFFNHWSLVTGLLLLTVVVGEPAKMAP